MGRKRILKIPNSATIKCPSCNKNTRMKIEKDRSPQFFHCRKCKKDVQTPITKCCIICAFSDKKCLHSLLMEAHAKGLQVKEEKQKEEKLNAEERINKQLEILKEKISNAEHQKNHLID
ncbi:hypothetical protein HZA33_01950 [Candidatus Pacearchaeota archaeon]|nr:hypothetical protein [Candidatus Pacearchaeota archaeon]